MKNILVVLAALILIFNIKCNIQAEWILKNDDWYFISKNGEIVVDTIKKSNDDLYYLDETGKMVKNYLLEDYGDNTYYFGKDGKMVKDTFVDVNPRFFDDNDLENDKLYYTYYFEKTGKAFKAKDNVKKKTIDGKTYIFDERGRMLIGFIGEDGEIDDTDDDSYPYKDCIYYASRDGVLQSGWMAYVEGTDDERHEEKEKLYLYFSPSNYEKIYADTSDLKNKTINGKKYVFDETGVMLSKWDYYDISYEISTLSNTKYYGEEDDGSLARKKWVYEVPSKYIDNQFYQDDEKKWFYFGNDGLIIKNCQKTINKKKYTFDENGIMQTGLVIFVDAKYEATIDIDDTSADMMAKEGIYLYKKHDNDNPSSKVIDIANTLDNVKLYYHTNDGDRIDGKVVVPFADDDSEMFFKSNGAVTGKYKKKYYSNGILLKAKKDNKLGLIVANEDFSRMPQMNIDNTKSRWPHTYQDASYNPHVADYLVVNEKGSVKKKGIYKDADENYWVVGNNGFLLNIFNIKVKSENVNGNTIYKYEEDGNKNSFRYFIEYNSYANGNADKIGDKRFDVVDIYDSSWGVSTGAPENQRWHYPHMVVPDDDYLLNFTLDSEAYGN